VDAPVAKAIAVGAERDDIERQLAAHGTAKVSYLTSDVVVSNCALRNGTIEYSLRKPFVLRANVSESDNWHQIIGGEQGIRTLGSFHYT